MEIIYKANDGTIFHDKDKCEKYEYDLVAKNTQARWYAKDGAPTSPGDAELVFLPNQKAWEDFRWLADYEGCYYPEAEGNWVWDYSRFIPMSTRIEELKDEIKRLEDLAAQ
mgnify:CR=1 FL=1